MKQEIGIGSKYTLTFSVTAPPLRYAVIQDIQNTAPVVINATNHGMSNADNVWIVRCKGINKLINSKYDIDGLRTLHSIEVIDANSFRINAVNAVGWGEYEPGSGVVCAKTPVDLSGAVVTMNVRTSVESSVKVVEVNNGLIGGVSISANQINIQISASTTTTLKPGDYVYSVEVLYPNGTTDILLEGDMIVVEEITRV